MKKLNKKLLLVIIPSIFIICIIGVLCYEKIWYEPGQLYTAISNNNIESVKALTSKGVESAKFTGVYSSNGYILDEVSLNSTPRIAKVLVTNGINIEDKTELYHNGLFAATVIEDLQLCNMMINKGIDIYDTNEDNFTVLDYAINNLSYKMVDYYLNNWFELDSSNITTSLSLEKISSGELTRIDALKMTRYLLKYDENASTELPSILKAAYLGNSDEVINLCIEENLDELDTAGKHLLSYVCAAFCNLDTIKTLESNEIDITHFNSYYIDTLRCAAAYNNSNDVLSYLISKCKNISTRHKDKKTDNGSLVDITPIDYVIKNENFDILEVLLAKNCAPNIDTYKYYSDITNKDILTYLAKEISNSDGNTMEDILNNCVEKNNSTALTILIDTLGSSIIKKLTVGSSLKKAPNNSMVDILADNNIKINYKPIFINAIKNHDINSVKTISKKLDNFDFGDDEDTIPIAVAIKCGDTEIFDYLVNNLASLDIKMSLNESLRSLTNRTNYSKEIKKHFQKTCIKQIGFFAWL